MLVPRLSAILAASSFPNNWMPEADWNPAATLSAMRVLRTLLWFGLVEFWEPDDMFTIRYCRKSALFDRFLLFSVGLAVGRPAGRLA